MAFEVKYKDVAGRIGRLVTKTGFIETPILLPVVNPFAPAGIPPSEIEKEFHCEAMITNAYLLWKHARDESIRLGVHKLLNFSKTIMTDSGGYQLLTYGDVEVAPGEIISFQERIGSDIAVILDVPTGGHEKRERANFTVDETIRRAIEWASMKKESNVLWAGPIQGGTYSDLVGHSAKEMGKLNFDIYAIGSPTQIMESYRFDKLVDLIATAKLNLPIEKPIHLFGAGHPSMFSLAVALGCDIFDSASYALYAKDDRYMTGLGTRRLSELRERVCICPECEKYVPSEMASLPHEERFKVVARHNLHMCLNEIRVIKQAIYEGRLWELVENRARTHPQLLEGVRRLKKYRKYLEKYSPAVKKRAIFYGGPESLIRPEVTRHLTKLYSTPTPSPADILVILPEPPKRPFSKTKEQKKYRKIIRSIMTKDDLKRIHICTVSKFFGLVPMELDQTYPLGQHEVPRTPDLESKRLVSHAIKSYIRSHKYRTLVLHADYRIIGEHAKRVIIESCIELGMRVLATPKVPMNPRSREALLQFREAIHEARQTHISSAKRELKQQQNKPDRLGV